MADRKQEREVRKVASTWLLVAIAAACLAGARFTQAAAPDAPVLLDGVAAHVNQHVITIGDVLIMMEPQRRDLLGKYSGQELRDRLAQAYDDTLNSLIERFVVLDAYDKGKGRIPDWAVDKRADEVIRESFDGDRNALLDALAEENMTYADWRKRIQQQMIVASMRSSSVEQNLNVTPAEIQRYYAKHRADYATPAQIHLALIAMPRTGDTNGADRAAAEAVEQRLRAGEDFAAVARKASRDSKADEGGDWGWLDAGSLRPELAKAVADLKPGGVSEVIASESDFYVLKLIARQDAKTNSLADVEDEVENKLKLERAQASYKAWVDRLKQDAYVRVFDVNLF